MHSKLMPLTLTIGSPGQTRLMHLRLMLPMQTQESREQTLLMYLRRVFNLYKVPVDLAFLLFFRNRNWDS